VAGAQTDDSPVKAGPVSFTRWLGGGDQASRQFEYDSSFCWINAARDRTFEKVVPTDEVKAET
jgi:hypothetical protein